MLGLSFHWVVKDAAKGDALAKGGCQTGQEQMGPRRGGAHMVLWQCRANTEV